MKTNIYRTALCITTLCNMKCKHCLAFIPYYPNPRHIYYEEAKQLLSQYFKIVDNVEHFTVTGGEPLLNKDVVKIFKEVLNYSNQITSSLDFVTNATITISDELLNIFEKNNGKCKVVLSNYGPQLSKKLEIIAADLKKRNINYRISEFYGDNLYYDGWIDFNDHSKKHFTKEDTQKNSQKCIHRVGKYFVINDKELHCCSRSCFRMKKGIIPKNKNEYIDLLDDNITIEEKRNILMEMFHAKSSTSCEHCVGLCNDVKRVMPAQQL